MRRQEQLYVLDAARKIAKGDEDMRLALLADMKEIGMGKRRRGAAPVTPAARAMLESDFGLARRLLASEGKAPHGTVRKRNIRNIRNISDSAAARFLVDRTKLYPGMDPDTLLRRYARRKAKR
jgi:hypothetical protein